MHTCTLPLLAIFDEPLSIHSLLSVNAINAKKKFQGMRRKENRKQTLREYFV